MRKVKRHMTLIELVIGMALTMLLLTIMTYFYKDILTLDAEAEKIQNEHFLINYLQNRLNSVVPRILPEYSIKKSKVKYFNFFTTGPSHLLAANSPSLIFAYHKGTDAIGALSFQDLGRLFLDKEGRFCLATWSIPEEWDAHINPTMTKEVLFEGVESLSFEFFVPPASNPIPAKKSLGETDLKPLAPIVDIPANGTWLKEWRKEYHRLPAMMKIILHLKAKPGSNTQESLVYAFPLPRSKYIVMFEQ